MMRAWLLVITERIHQGIGKFLDDALDQIQLAAMANADDGIQEPAICPSWHPETSCIDNGWPVTTSSGRS